MADTKGRKAPAPGASASSSVLKEVDVTIPSGHSQLKCRLEVPKKQVESVRVDSVKVTWIAQMGAIALAAMSCFSIVLGKMAFIWATVVLLGASGQQLPAYDFWLITIMIFTEGARVFLSSYEFKLRKSLFLRRGISWTASLSIPGFFISLVVLVFETCMLACTRVKPVYWRQILPLWSYGVVLYVVQFGSAGASFSLSTERLKQRHSIHLTQQSTTQLYAVYLFYALVVAETSLFLATRMVWDVFHWLLVMQVALFKTDMAKLYLLEEYFFAVHEKAVADSFVDASHLSLLSYSVRTLLLSDEPDCHGEPARYGMNVFRHRVRCLKRMSHNLEDANSRWIDCLVKLMDERFPLDIRKSAVDILISVLEEEKQQRARRGSEDAPTGTLMQQIAFDGRRIEALQKGMGHEAFKENCSRFSELVRDSNLTEEEQARMPTWSWTDPERGIRPA